MASNPASGRVSTASCAPVCRAVQAGETQLASASRASLATSEIVAKLKKAVNANLTTVGPEFDPSKYSLQKCKAGMVSNEQGTVLMESTDNLKDFDQYSSDNSEEKGYKSWRTQEYRGNLGMISREADYAEGTASAQMGVSARAGKKNKSKFSGAKKVELKKTLGPVTASTNVRFKQQNLNPNPKASTTAREEETEAAKSAEFFRLSKPPPQPKAGPAPSFTPTPSSSPAETSSQSRKERIQAEPAKETDAPKAKTAPTTSSESSKAKPAPTTTTDKNKRNPITGMTDEDWDLVEEDSDYDVIEPSTRAEPIASVNNGEAKIKARGWFGWRK